MKTIGVIGLGSIGMRHAKNLVAMGHRVISWDPQIEGTRFGIECSTARGAILSKVEALIISSPTPLHQDHIIACAGKPTFVEKPISDRFPVVRSSVVMVGYNLRFHSCVKKAKEWLDAGLIGVPLWANFTCAQYNGKAAYLRDGVILNWSHELDLACYLVGRVAPGGITSSTRLTDGKDDLTDILLTHESGCRSGIHLDYLTKPEQREFSIQGTKGRIHSDLVRRWITASNTGGGVIEMYDGPDSFDENYIEEMQAFIDRIDGKETIGCTGAEGLAVLDICLQVRKQAGL